MSLDLTTPTALAARQTLAYCPRLPGYVAVPRPEAAPFTCPTPCGGRCPFSRPALFAPVKLRRHTCRLELRATLDYLTTATARPDAGYPTRPACGSLHLN